jgi:hypothetical protein
MEVFLSDKLDLKVLDVVEVSGYKGRRWSIDSMVVVDFEQYKDDAIAKGKYDPSLTVAAVQKQRNEQMDHNLKAKIAQAAFAEDEQLIHLSEDEEGYEGLKNDEEEVSQHEHDEEYMDGEEQSSSEAVSDDFVQFSLPDDIVLITRMTTILKNHPGDQTIVVGGTTHHVSEE